ncbi:MAG: DNA polymerase III subunit beta [Microgenomates bacterium OLB23]|nr:MAG: DNA polymerase III subunit beta [Microgenomates bacterium OLB23]
MKIHIQKGVFEENLSTGSRFISAKISSIQSIQGTRLTTYGDHVCLTTTNLNDFYYIKIKAIIEKEGDIIFDSKKTLEFISLLSNTDITLETEGGSLVISQGKNKGYFNTYKTDDFPPLPEVVGKSVEVPKKVVDDLYSVLFSASKEETRPVLTGVYFGTKGGGEVVTTDGFRLSLLKLEKDSIGLPEGIIPSHILNEVVKQAKKGAAVSAIIAETEKVVQFSIGDVVIISRIIEGEFPPYEKVIPKKPHNKDFGRKRRVFKKYKNLHLFSLRENGEYYFV